MSQSRDEIAEQVVALAGSVSSEKAEKMRALVELARREGCDAALAPVVSPAPTPPNSIEKRVADLELELAVLVEGTLSPPDAAGVLTLAQRLSKIEVALDAFSKNDEKGHKWHAERIDRMTGRVSAIEESLSKLRERVVEFVRTEMAKRRCSCPPDADDAHRWGCEASEDGPPGASTGQQAVPPRVVEARAARSAPSGEPRTIKCDGCERPLSKVETHSSGIIICTKCGGDSTPAAPSPTIGVEEMAERLMNAQLKHYGLSPRAWSQMDEEERAYWLALARAALDAQKEGK